MNQSISYKRHRFPPQIIAWAVWLYYRFPLNLRLVEELLLERGLSVAAIARTTTSDSDMLHYEWLTR